MTKYQQGLDKCPGSDCGCNDCRAEDREDEEWTHAELMGDIEREEG